MLSYIQIFVTSMKQLCYWFYDRLTLLKKQIKYAIFFAFKFLLVTIIDAKVLIF